MGGVFASPTMRGAGTDPSRLKHNTFRPCMRGVAWRGVVWCGVVWCWCWCGVGVGVGVGVVWCAVVCGVVCRGVLWCWYGVV